MGNCMTCLSQPNVDGKEIETDGREMEIDASVPVKKTNYSSCRSCIVIRRKLQNGEVYHLAPFLKQSVKPTTDNRKLKIRNVKIVLTTEQLKLLLSGSNKFQIKTRVACVRRKWLPSLPTIQEVNKLKDYKKPKQSSKKDLKKWQQVSDICVKSASH
ncbi:hypothetical protein RIF29_40839 [Crotalaria pallida]|uniref:Uncharacterized protein n=1 Tax=Crotalaria pallida TaxID=3830 RepID=A0AAN9E685_CROPI